MDSRPALASSQIIILEKMLSERDNEIASLQGELESARVDAERYRWLRDKIENQDLVIAKVGSWSLESWSGDNPDAAIDAARGGK